MSEVQTIVITASRSQSVFRTDEYVAPTMGGLGTALLVFLILMKAAARLSTSENGPSKTLMWGIAAVSIFAGVTVFGNLWLIGN
jgi:hypothetical protein